MTAQNGYQRFASEYILIDFAIDFLKAIFFSILIRFLSKIVRHFFPKVFMTYKFVAFKIDGKVATTRSKIILNINSGTNILAVYKLGVVAPFYTAYYTILLKVGTIRIKIQRNLWIPKRFLHKCQPLISLRS